jgi:hypothetical protein
MDAIGVKRDGFFLVPDCGLINERVTLVSLTLDELLEFFKRGFEMSVGKHAILDEIAVSEFGLLYDFHTN